MKKIKLLVLIIILAFSLPFIYGGCGGGGGGGNGGAEPLSFSGVESAADITSDNAQEIVSGAFFAADAGTTIGPLSSSQRDEKYDNLDAPILKVAQVFASAIHQVDLSSSDIYTINAVIDDQGTIDGGCGGDAFFTIRADDVAGTFSGTMLFRNYCDDEITINGTANFFGSFDTITGEIFEFGLSFINMSVRTVEGTFIFDGDTFFDESNTPIIVDVEFLIQEPSGKVFWANNYIISITEGPDFVDAEATGRFYHPDYGFVDLSTEVTFRIFDIDDRPSSGTLLFEGADNTTARLIALDALTVRVTADTDGDGIDDFDTGAINWEDL